ncbi:hypothetical protein C8F04DRAFT_1062513 [Mycena alexandri]|uniref:Ribosomal protein mS38 C-terminal domain-containing protein n=1 Tax=Mycena alexandri TaxID=1745969 RepID=A0AAD6XC70_9AGAR|nr:hypothetical protein C8F04DRAFT_1062513 [Mycena alexandri]
MSAFTRFLHPIPAARRSYSSFFSKPGGGRYFTSHKPAKPVVAVNNTKEQPVSPPDAADTPAAQSTASGSVPNALNPDDTASLPSVASPPRLATLVPLAAEAVRHPEGLPAHPTLEPEALQLHQFFSMHRPLLLLADPPSILRSPHPAQPLFPRPSYEAHSRLPDSILGNPHEPMEPPVDSDAEAARQLTRALTITRAGATISWDNTLRRLGMDVDLAARDLRAREWDQEWEDILADSTKQILAEQQILAESMHQILTDSTKRKRRKKMKKHKYARIFQIFLFL